MIKVKLVKQWRTVVESPTLMTWLSFLVRSGTVVFVMPLVLLHFSDLEVALWLIFGVLIRVRDVLDFGMLNNVSRLVAYANSGSKSIGDLSFGDNKEGGNIGLVCSIDMAAGFLYIRTISISFALLLLMGGGVVWRTLAPVDGAPYLDYWLALFVHLLGCVSYLWGNRYVAFLTGTNKIALLKRWDALFGAASIITLIVFILAGSSFFWFILATNFWIVLTVARNWFLWKVRVNWDRTDGVDAEIVEKIVSLSKRDFLGALFGVGFLQIINIAIASFFPIAIVNSYLVLDRLIEQIKGVSRAPFYTKMPIFAKYVTRGDRNLLEGVAKRGLLLSYAVCCLGILFVYVFGSAILSVIGVESVDVDTNLWLLMGAAALVDRYAAMHNQLYLVIYNKVLTHITLFVTMLLTILIITILYSRIGIYSVPLAYILAPLFFYAWYLPYKNYSYLCVGFFKFEANNLFVVAMFWGAVVLTYWSGFLNKF